MYYPSRNRYRQLLTTTQAAIHLDKDAHIPSDRNLLPRIQAATHHRAPSHPLPPAFALACVVCHSGPLILRPQRLGGEREGRSFIFRPSPGTQAIHSAWEAGLVHCGSAYLSIHSRKKREKEEKKRKKR